ncbi:putative spermidine/putrescine transport system substrate-binding protein [Actinoplanes lutulentus]|uniref:Putative spermidine/putrescine transport system substrate-binding protein n=1 Tax=Actinoplanes lutulentus TaxID=1287878 RepID=A0A327YY70_9ACTN|nr:ABC transporter substrate-binding protein [Actinoplanes lutulentus]MBB2943082.1 putative spermidine/putrescine transport system substrate-binding protein [Actinoplanes lutulentus]RAK26652.1 putative spermidine/putrescine transport system substrate-binding protein [Actinoplanes lutulentus]
MRNRWMTAVLAAGVLTLAACGGGGDSGGSASGPGGLEVPKIDKLAALGAGEGEVNIVSWAGYVEDGSTDKAVDWVTGFEKETGCQVNNKIAGTSDEMVALMKTGEYDVVSASGDASLRLIYGGDVAPVNTDLIANYKDVFDGLKNKQWNSVDGAAYGVPHGRGANLLMYRTDSVTPAPTSWNAVFDANSPYKGKITAYDSPIYIADAALYLMKTKPELNIKNPYALDDTQFQAAVDLLKAQNELIGEYWSDYTKEVQAFKAGNSVLGTTWQVITNLTKADGAPVEAILPTEGATGWSDTWMVSASTKHPNCAYLWMNHIISPQANAGVAEWFGEAPSNKLSCALTADKSHCATFHADDEAYFDQIWYWTTPLAQCVDGRTDVTCKDYAAWTQAWTTIKG